MTEHSFSLAWVSAGQLSADDLRWLTAADASAPPYERLTAVEIMEGLGDGSFQLFRFVPGPGVLLTKVAESNGLKRLILLKAAGYGVGWTFHRIADLLRTTAREWGCEGVVAHVYGDQERLAKAMMKVGARIESLTMFLEA